MRRLLSLCVLAGLGWVFAGDLGIEDREKFNELYWNAQPAAVRVVRTMQSLSPERLSKAVELARQGYRVDAQIAGLGFEAWGTMKGRQLNGFKWAPALLQDYSLVMWPLNPWELGPNTPAPEGTIKVSLDPADYPAIDQPVKEETSLPRITNPVGSLIYGNVYQGNFGDNWPVGAVYTDARGRFEKKAVASPFGLRVWWERL
ncbi:MAG: hypothetical protein ABFD60_03300 [Bryobacteraceae bacterium]